MAIEDSLIKELDLLTQESELLLTTFQSVPQEGKSKFVRVYQSWYTSSARLVHLLAPERSAEFKGYYAVENDQTPQSKYAQKEMRYKDEASYTILDYILGVEAKKDTGYMGGEPWDPSSVVEIKLNNQIQILNAVHGNIHKVIFNLEAYLLSQLQDKLIESSLELVEVHPRAAGVLAVEILKNHLLSIIQNRNMSPEIAPETPNDMAILLKQEGVINVPLLGKIEMLIEVGNSCQSTSPNEPSSQTIQTLILGVKEVVRMIY